MAGDVTTSQDKLDCSNWWDDIVQGGVPQVLLGKHVSRAIGRLIAGVTDIPAAALENLAQRIRDNTAARSKVIDAIAVAGSLDAAENPDIVKRGIERWAGSLARKQQNREAVAGLAVRYLAEEPPPAGLDDGPTDDFMNLFEAHAENASSDKLRDLFARILAGELRKPGTFSLRTIQFVSVMDQELAGAIQKARSWLLDNVMVPNWGPMGHGEYLMTVGLLEDVSILRSGFGLGIAQTKVFG